jgi:hypothetical protein
VVQAAAATYNRRRLDCSLRAGQRWAGCPLASTPASIATMKTAEEIIGYLADRIGHIYFHPKPFMFAAAAQELDRVLDLYAEDDCDAVYVGDLVTDGVLRCPRCGSNCFVEMEPPARRFGPEGDREETMG